MKKLFCGIAACILATSASYSQANSYIGLSLGETDINSPIAEDGNSIAITGGHKFNKNFAMEVSYINLGKWKDNIAPIWTLELDGFNFSAVGIFPVNDTIDIFGKFGIFKWEVTLDEAGTGEIASDDGTDTSIGFGAAVNLSNQSSIVLEYQEFDLEDDDVSNISIGFRANF